MVNIILQSQHEGWNFKESLKKDDFALEKSVHSYFLTRGCDSDRQSRMQADYGDDK
ncbi:conserved hypothetical protein [Ricinus communis]|uniref:Uncharacterized protein n=1 Tax=Ricinus communis TaxID=3988 RepID=B9SWV2_RICCO|nr:conserved hypothetical protein [Ricinus communis]